MLRQAGSAPKVSHRVTCVGEKIISYISCAFVDHAELRYHRHMVSRKQERAVETDSTASSESSAELTTLRARPIDVFFSPQAVAVIGATETLGSVGRNVIANLVSSPFGGMVFPVNAKRASVL